MAPTVMSGRGRPAIYGFIVALLLLGCDGTTLIVINSCSGVLIASHRGVVRVGETLRLDANFDSPECGTPGIAAEEWRWSSSDTLIARIDSVTGLAKGVAPGDVVIEVHHARNSEIKSRSGLTVVAH